MDADALRILDANANRLREALRVIEDYARFVSDDADAAGAVKECRHALRHITAVLGPDVLLAARDIESDVGAPLKTPTELARADHDDVVRAAFGRATEAARALGEYGKLVSAEFAAAAEQLRYRCYALEQRVVLRGALRARFRAARLYVLITAELCRGDWLEVAAAALRGGAGVLQLREKQLDDGELLGRARQLRELTRRHNALLIVNDRPDIARLAGADGVHVGQGDLAVRHVRRIAGAALLVGKSTHTPAQFAAALAEEPDYVAVGPMYASTTKPQAHVAGPQTLRAVRGQTALPLIAIGGITAARAAEVRAAGADCLAICSAVIDAPDAARAAAELR